MSSDKSFKFARHLDSSSCVFLAASRMSRRKATCCSYPGLLRRCHRWGMAKIMGCLRPPRCLRASCAMLHSNTLDSKMSELERSMIGAGCPSFCGLTPRVRSCSGFALRFEGGRHLNRRQASLRALDQPDAILGITWKAKNVAQNSMKVAQNCRPVAFQVGPYPRPD